MPEPASLAALGLSATKIVVQLRKVRETRGLTQAEVAGRMGLPPDAVAEIERRPWAASFARILAYAGALGVELVVREGSLDPVGAAMTTG